MMNSFIDFLLATTLVLCIAGLSTWCIWHLEESKRIYLENKMNELAIKFVENKKGTNKNGK